MRPVLALLVATCTACVPQLVSDGLLDDPWTLPDNTWPGATPPEDLDGEGFYRDQVMPDFRLLDQHGDEVSLWQFYGRVVVVDISTMWCGPCQKLGEGVAATQADWEADGLVYVTVLPENVDGDPPSQEDLNDWADEYDITSPVVADPEKGWSAPAVPQDQYPYVAILDTDLVVSEVVKPPTDANVRAAVEALLGPPNLE